MKEYCVLPITSLVVHQFLPLIQSVLVVGPEYMTRNVAQAVATEAGAFLFHIDPEEVLEIFPDKKKFQTNLMKVCNVKISKIDEIYIYLYISFISKQC